MAALCQPAKWAVPCTATTGVTVSRVERSNPQMQPTRVNKRKVLDEMSRTKRCGLHVPCVVPSMRAIGPLVRFLNGR